MRIALLAAAAALVGVGTAQADALFKPDGTPLRAKASTVRSVEATAAPPFTGDLNLAVQAVLRDSYLETNKDLRFYADKVRHFNGMKEEIRDALTAARDAAGEADSLADELKAKCPRCALPGRIKRDAANVDAAVAASDYNAAAAAIAKLEDELASMGDDAQLANIDLQNSLQKQQQTLQTISNVSKMMHDTAMAIIRKIG